MRARQILLILVVLLWSIDGASAQFGLRCDAPDFAQSLAAMKPTPEIEAAVAATCAFNKKFADIRAIFGKSGWSWDLLPKARSDIAELTVLADKAATLSFAAGDPRGLGNIRNMYIRIGDQKRWLSDEEKKFAKRQQALAAQNPGSVTSEAAQVAGSGFVFVVFQDNLSADDQAAFLHAYDATIADGPAQDGSYRLKLAAPPPQNELQLVLESMKSQTNVVKSAFAK